MLNLLSTDSRGIDRREFLRIGSLAAGGVTLADVCRQRALGQEARNDTAVIQVFLCGGPSQHDTFDPKPLAPAECRPFDSIETRMPGVRVTEFFPRLAAIFDEFSVVRGVHHEDGSHNHAVHWLQTGRYPNNLVYGQNQYPASGAMIARYRGANTRGMPPNVAIPNGFYYSTASYLGARYDPMEIPDPNQPDFAVPNLNLIDGITSNRLDDRLQMLRGLDRIRRDIDTHGQFAAMDGFQAAAYDMLSGPAVRRAFDINAEDPRLRDRYGRTRVGQGCLLARRLVEAGVTFVNVKDYEFFEWDLHGTVGGPGIVGTKTKGPHLDMALSSLILDLRERGLINRVLVQVFGEFGRTPNVNTTAGRDHWGNVFTALFAGGGLRHGQVIGSSDAKGALPLDRPLGPTDLLATMYRFLGMSTDLSPIDYAGRPMPLLPNGEPIREMFG
ncbi:MAG: hypothetical protein JWN70_1774 [Planctomycetaceae bacterium]|nr:hypothetical protein [Planctomycetaceae bacterium]